MKGDFSRLTGDKATRRHYSGVLKQQGRVQLDSDWNELISIIDHQRKVRTIDTIGACGAPIHHSGFQILHPGGALKDLLIATGRMYVGGLLCETTPAAKLPIVEFLSANQVAVDDLNIEGIALKAKSGAPEDQWFLICTEEQPEGMICQINKIADHTIELDQDVSSLKDHRHPYLKLLLRYSDQVDYPTAPAITGDQNEPGQTGQTDLVYLETWERHITTIEDPELREVALGGPDTDTRSKIIAQVKIFPNVGDLSCADDIERWNKHIAVPNGRLTTRQDSPDPAADPCELGESGGYHGLENHLYRVEIHQGGPAQTATFKWSRDNAAQAYAIEEFTEPTKIRLKQPGKDEILRIKKLDWIEISNDRTDLDTETPGKIVRVKDVLDGTLLVLDTDVSAFQGRPFPKVRRWDVSDQLATVETTVETGRPFQLEDGIEIEFSGTTFKTGYYWVFSARTLTGEIEELTQAPPMGIRRQYCKLALVTWNADGDAIIEDCRPVFPPLTEPSRTNGCCTVTVGENGYKDIQSAFDALPDQSGTICIDPGLYFVDQPILIKNAKRVTIKGCGGKAVIVNRGDNPRAGSVLQIIDSEEVAVQDLWAVTLQESKVVEIRDSIDCSLTDCWLVGGRGGAITCAGYSIGTRITDNTILGWTGIRFRSLPNPLQQLHNRIEIKGNIFSVVDCGVRQDELVPIIGLDLIDNRMMGCSLRTISQGFFPENLFTAIAQEDLFTERAIAHAEVERKRTEPFEAILQGNLAPANSLFYRLATEATWAKAGNEPSPRGQTMPFPTISSLVTLQGTVSDSNILDNNFVGRSGLLADKMIIESKIGSNIILGSEVGIELGAMMDVVIEENFLAVSGIGIYCRGELVDNLSVLRNRIASAVYAIQFREEEDRIPQQVTNVQIADNSIAAKLIGIRLDHPYIMMEDLNVSSNRITGCANWAIIIRASDENVPAGPDGVAPGRTKGNNFQRVIQHNTIAVAGGGIRLGVSYGKVLDNDIHIDHQPGSRFQNHRGVIVEATDCIIANNQIRGVVAVDSETGEPEKLSLGGIYLDIKSPSPHAWDHDLAIRHNTIIGGSQNGIEIASNIRGLTIEGNKIVGMGVNGIAAQDHVRSVYNLTIKDNQIRDCHQLLAHEQRWWKYAGIVLTRVRDGQITGNTIEDNGTTIQHRHFVIGGIYADGVTGIFLSENLIRRNGVLGVQHDQGAIHFQPEFPLQSHNSGMEIANNLVYSQYAPALVIGNYRAPLPPSIGYQVNDERANISNNQFGRDGLHSGPLVQLNINCCNFSHNQLSVNTTRPGNTDIDLGYGENVVVIGNLISAPIVSHASHKLITNNLKVN